MGRADGAQGESGDPRRAYPQPAPPPLMTIGKHRDESRRGTRERVRHGELYFVALVRIISTYRLCGAGYQPAACFPAGLLTDRKSRPEGGCRLIDRPTRMRRRRMGRSLQAVAGRPLRHARPIMRQCQSQVYFVTAPGGAPLDIFHADSCRLRKLPPDRRSN